MRNAYARNAHAISVERTERERDIELVAKVDADSAGATGNGNTAATTAERAPAIRGTQRGDINVDILISILAISSMQGLSDGQLRNHRIN